MFTKDYKEKPYWWARTAPLQNLDKALPEKVEMLVIGAGFTGLQAALQTARGGRETLVIDAEYAGFGASTRNGGQISTSIKPGYHQLVKKHGKDLAFALHTEGHNSLQYTTDFIHREKIDASLHRAGRFHAAHNPAQYEKLARIVKNPVPGLKTEAYMIPRAEQHKELGTDAYFGGAIFPGHSSVDPGAYHRGLLQKTFEAGAKVIAHCPALNIERTISGFVVQTAKGVIQADKIILATNGYTGKFAPWHQRRIIPIGSYMIATEPLSKDVMDRLMPKNRIASDSRRVVYYYRPSPDRSRILFGGRVSLRESNPRVSGPKLHNALTRIFPELKTAKISNSWMGYVGYTFDTLMHIGEDDGLFYAMGYCGSGVGMAGYLGMRAGQQALGLKEGQTAFNNLPFQTRPFYTGNPWFLSASVMYYKFLDSLNI